MNDDHSSMPEVSSPEVRPDLALREGSSRGKATLSSPLQIDSASDSDEEPIRKRLRIEGRIRCHTQQHSPKPPSQWSSPISDIPPAGVQHHEGDVESLEELGGQINPKYQELLEDNQLLRQQNEHLENTLAQQRSMINKIAASNGILDAAMDSREAQMRVGLSNIKGTKSQIQEQTKKLVDFSNDTTYLVSRLVVGPIQDLEVFLNDEEKRMMWTQYNEARPSAEIEAIMDEKIDFVDNCLDHSNEKDTIIETESEDSALEGPSTNAVNTATNSDGNNVSPATSNRRRKVPKGPARKPTGRVLEYVEEHYTNYDLVNPAPPPAVFGPFLSFAQYDTYQLYSNPRLKDINTVPTSGVRIDDLTISKVIGNLTQITLHRHWPADLDMRGMIRARRVPLGRAAKMWVDAGTKDIDDMVVNEGEEGYYYKIWGGLHPLMGAEGRLADLYMIRPSYEEFRCEGFTFKKGLKAVIQKPEDYESDGGGDLDGDGAGDDNE